MSFNFGTPAPLGGGTMFSTPAANNNNNNTPQGGGAPKIVRFDTTTSASGSSPFTGFGTPAAATSAGSGQTLAGLLAAPQTTGTGGGLGLGGALGGQPSLLSQLGATTKAAPVLTFNSGLTGGLGGGLSSTVPQQSTIGSSTGFSFSGNLGAPAASSAATGLFGFSTAAAATSGAIASNTGLGTTATCQGLGGIDPKSSAGGACGTSIITGSGGSKACDSKAIKETELQPLIRTTVDEFTKHVKSQKVVREEIARMSVKPLYRVEEDVKNLRQQLLVVSNSLHRYASSIEKIKLESTRELRHAEIAQRTRDTPPGLQFENTAPSAYFDRLVDEFESAMTTYRSQIAETEAHFSSTSRGGVVPLTPQELMALFTKLNEGFMGLAARLHVVHEAVRAQKEAFINNRRAVHGDYDAADIFDRRRKCQVAPNRPLPSTVGLTPFSSTSNSAAIAMMSGLGRTLTPSGPSASSGVNALTGSGGLMFGGGLATQTTPGFNSSWANQKTGFGFGANTQKLAFGTARPLG